MTTSAPAPALAAVRAAAVLRPVPPGPEGRPRLAAADYERAAATLRATEPQLRAVLLTEVGPAGGFLTDGTGRARILYEAHVFGRETGGRFNASHPDISSPTWNRTLYRGGAAEYGRLEEALPLDATAALRSASWGLGQVMGFHHALCGYPDVCAFVAVQQRGEPEQLDTFAAFLRGAGLADELRAITADPEACRALAKGYNGAGYAEQGYHIKLAANLATLLSQPVPPSIAGMVRMGQAGAAVREVQKALNHAAAALLVDGIFGRSTEVTVMAFQDAHRLRPDGVVGPITRRALGL